VDDVCKGLSEDEHCNSHDECDACCFCKTAITWPYKSVCAKLKTSYEQCESDVECGTAQYCWYASVEDRENYQKKCLPTFSQEDQTEFGWESADPYNPTLDEFTINGKYCKSGLAYPASDTKARCAPATSVTFDGQTLSSPYPCDPTDNTKKC